jgi:hypothetical protein
MGLRVARAAAGESQLLLWAQHDGGSARAAPAAGCRLLDPVQTCKYHETKTRLVFRFLGFVSRSLSSIASMLPGLRRLVVSPRT